MLMIITRTMYTTSMYMYIQYIYIYIKFTYIHVLYSLLNFRHSCFLSNSPTQFSKLLSCSGTG